MNHPPRLRLALRIFRRHQGRMLFFASCIAIGVGFLFSIANLLDSINSSIARQARDLMSADLQIASSQPLPKPLETYLSGLPARGYRVLRGLHFSSMLRHETKKDTTAFLVSLKAVEKGFPLYGELRLDPPDALGKFFGQRACLVAESIAQQHHLKVGDTLRLGYAVLTVAGVIKKEPDLLGLGGFNNLAPRVMIPLEIVEATGLIQYGSRLSYQTWVAAQPSTPQASVGSLRFLRQEIRKVAADPQIRVTTAAEAQPAIRDTLQRIGIFFFFVSLVALLLGAIGMATSVTTFLNEQLETVGIFRCLGLGPSDIRSIYTTLCGILGILGGLLGTALGWALTWLGISILGRLLSLPLESQISLSNVFEGLLLASLLTLGLNAAAVRALAQMAPQQILADRQRQIPLSPLAVSLTAGFLLLGLFLYAARLSSSVLVGGFFTAALVGAMILCLLLILGGLRIYQAISGLLQGSGLVAFVLRHGFRQLIRQRSRTLTFLLALSIGVMLISTLEMLQYNLTQEIRQSQLQQIPNLFLVDVQTDQIASLQGIMKKYKARSASFSPLIRARLTHIQGQEIQRQALQGSLEERMRIRSLQREYNLTYKDRPNPSETLLQGAFWTKDAADIQISLEERWAARLGLRLGQTLRFDIVGRPIEGRITSIRRINWRSLLPNFLVVINPKALQDAPQTLITSVSVDSPSIRPFQAEIVAAHPNVSVIDLGTLITLFQSIFGAFIQALQGIAWSCLAVGLLILAGTLSMGRYERREKVALLRALGCDRLRIFLIDVVEFLAIGLLTAAIVLLVSWALGRVLASQMEIPFALAPPLVLQVLGLSLLLPLFVGLLSNWKTYQAGVRENLLHAG